MAKVSPQYDDHPAPHRNRISERKAAGLMTHTGTHIDAPFHFFSQAETVDQLPLTHFHAPCLSLGFNDLEKETAAHKVLLGARKLIIEDICVPETMLKGSTRHFAAFPVLIQGAGRAWTLAVAWDEGETA
jgi:kynurenine formamidase